jgi:hypothetical protein
VDEVSPAEGPLGWARRLRRDHAHAPRQRATVSGRINLTRLQRSVLMSRATLMRLLSLSIALGERA